MDILLFLYISKEINVDYSDSCNFNKWLSFLISYTFFSLHIDIHELFLFIFELAHVKLLKGRSIIVKLVNDRHIRGLISDLCLYEEAILDLQLWVWIIAIFY
jgi:hypothetical protein